MSDSRLIQVTVTPVNDLPMVLLTRPTNNAVYLTNEPIIIEASASDIDRQVLKVEFFANETKLGESTNGLYRFVWSNAPLGDHALHARALDNLSATNDSPAVNVSVVTPGFVMIEPPGAERNVRLVIEGNGKTYQIEASTNLTDWTTIGTVTNTENKVEFTDQFSANYPHRFYKARLIR